VPLKFSPSLIIDCGCLDVEHSPVHLRLLTTDNSLSIAMPPQPSQDAPDEVATTAGDAKKPASQAPDDDSIPGTNFCVSFIGDDDKRSPKSMSTARKWFITMIVSTTSLCVACTSSLYVGTYGQLEKEFQASEIVVTLGLSLFVIGLGLSPMVLAPLSEVCFVLQSIKDERF
jgi:hypothetical protein